MVSVRVPATSANVGCGFDSLGVALTLYTTFKFEKLDSGLEFVGFEERFSNENNLVYQTFAEVAGTRTLTIINHLVSLRCISSYLPY